MLVSRLTMRRSVRDLSNSGSRLPQLTNPTANKSEADRTDNAAAAYGYFSLRAASLSCASGPEQSQDNICANGALRRDVTHRNIVVASQPSPSPQYHPLD